MKENFEKVIEYGKEIRLLYVEDNKDTREGAVEILDKMFPSMQVAVDGEDALKNYEENGADLLITDLEMPKFNGLELIRKLKEKDRDLAVLITSAYDENDYLSRAISLGVDGYIVKPIIFEPFLELLVKTTKNIVMREENRLYKKSLEEQVAVEISKREEKEGLLMHQTKMAAMGDMIDAIAHQWKQPLNAISMYMDLLHGDALDKGHLDSVEIKQCQDDIDEQIEHLLNTLNEFRTFFKTDKEMKLFSMAQLIDSVLILMKDELILNKIETEVIVSEDDTMPGSVNELKHLIINLINNAKDAFNEKKIKKRKLTFRVTKSKNLLLEVEDNAGGIEQSIKEDIFKPRISTKNESQGSGIGLYISQQIVHKHHGEIRAENSSDGARFLATFPLA